MANSLRSRFTGLVLLALAAAVPGPGALAAPVVPPVVPVVYQDANIVVRAGIAEAGSKPLHLGDALSFVVSIEFDAGDVRIETPDDEWFQRAIAAASGLRVYESVAIAGETQARGGRVRVTSYWRLQALDCPANEITCAGNKRYEMPIMTVEYQLAGGGAAGVDSRSARFRPWPGELTIVPAIPEAPRPDSKLTDLLPGGAHAPVIESGETPAAAGWLLPVGAFLLLLSFVPAPRQGQPDRAAQRGRQADTRWQHALTRLEAEDLDDEEWADLLRRAVSWYCLDELGTNPYRWLGPAGSARLAEDPDTGRWHEFFIEVLGQHGVAGEDRKVWLGRFREQAGLQTAAA